MNEGLIDTFSNSIRQLSEGRYLHNLISFLLLLLLLILTIFILYYLIHIGNQLVRKENKIWIGKKQMLNFTIIIVSLLFLIGFFRLRGLILELMAPFIFAVLLAYILNPLVRLLQHKGIPRLWGVILVYLLISFFILLISITLIPRMVTEVKKLMELLPKLGNETFDFLYDLYLKYNRNVDNLPTEFNDVKDLLRINIERIQKIIFSVFVTITNTLVAIFSRIIAIVLIPILAFYFLKDAEDFKRSLILLIPKSIRKEALEIAKDIDIVLGGFIRGQLIVAALVGLLTSIALLILKVEFAVLVGLIAGIANIIPYFGPIIGMVPAVLFALLDSPIKALWVVLVFTLIQQFESAVLSPKIVGKSVGLHPVVVILALLIGGKLFGLIGLLLAVPVTGTIKVLGKHLMAFITKF